MEKSLLELSVAGRRGVRPPECDVPQTPLEKLLPENIRRKSPPEIPEVSELEALRHFTRLSQLNFSVDTHFYPLGSCTMKYNPRMNEETASNPGFLFTHPGQPEEHLQGTLSVLYQLERWLSALCGMDSFSLQPAAGAHGELTALLILRAYHKSKGRNPRKILIPDTAHGTNPASAALLGFEVVQAPSNKDGLVDLRALASLLSEDVAGMMMTNPNTLGLFEKNILEISKRVHQKGALLYYDGANLNALLGISRPGDMGFDMVHVNLHKTFSTPHGGGGPGAGPVGVKRHLAPFLPNPRIRGTRNRFVLENSAKSIGRVRSFFGNVSILVRAHAYLMALGREGVRRVAENAVLNANYLLHKLSDEFETPFGKRCMHEFVLSAKKQKARGLKALDLAKGLLDEGFHAPTIYFPATMQEAMMIEPTETESREVLDAFAESLLKISKTEAAPQELPRKTVVRRLDEVKAAREPDVKWK